MIGWTVTAHARDRMHEMAVKEREVRAVLDDPETDYASAGKYAGDCRTAVRGRLAVAYDSATRTVITVLWHGIEYAR